MCRQLLHLFSVSSSSALRCCRLHRPHRACRPQDLPLPLGLIVGGYLILLLVDTGVLHSEMAVDWTDDFFSEVEQRIGGPWLHVWIQAATAMSNMGLFEAEMSSDSFPLLGIAEHVLHSSCTPLLNPLCCRPKPTSTNPNPTRLSLEEIRRRSHDAPSTESCQD